MLVRTWLTLLVWFGLALSFASASFALDWEVERNFRYFLYPSDVAVQRVAYDLYFGIHGRDATPEQLELFLNGEGFWQTPLTAAGGRRNSWPLAWREPGAGTPRDLIERLRAAEGRGGVPGNDDIERLGWASLLAHSGDRKRTMGFTDTCWNPAERLHSNCKAYGDYVRPMGWIVRVYDASAPADAQCDWSAASGAPASNAPRPTDFAAAMRAAAKASAWSQKSDCRELRVLVPSDASDPKQVKGLVQIARKSGDGSTEAIAVAPRDRLMIGFGDSFTSGEGNPERTAIFTDVSWGGIGLPKRAQAPSTRAQWTDRWCHRSVYSWQVRTAIDAALRSPHQSITLLAYGCSGAEIFPGLLFGFNGVEYDRTEDHGVLGSRAEFGLAYQELCDPASYRSSGSALAPPAGLEATALKGSMPTSAFADAALAAIRKDVARCGPVNRFKRSADAVLLDIGINDVGFSRWVEGLILQDPLRALLKGFIPRRATSGSCDADCQQTTTLLTQLAARYQILRDTLERYLLPDFGVDPANVIIPTYPRALEDENGALCGLGNAGMTVTTFPNSPFFPVDDAACQNRIWPNVHGPVTAIRNADDVAAIEWFRDNELNRRLRDFAAGPGPAFTAVETHVNLFSRRGFCATKDAASRSANPCFTFADFAAVPCSSNGPESMHVPRESGANCGSGAASFRPMRAVDYRPYRSRTRLFRTQNDVYMMIDGRDKQYIDGDRAGVLDLAGRTTSGAFHPSAEAHAIVASATATPACKAVGCER
jgi:hypothetical protein